MPTWTTKQGHPNDGVTSTLVLRQPSRNEVILSVLCASLISRAATIVRLCVCRANQYVSAYLYRRVLKSFWVLKVLPLTEKDRRREREGNKKIRGIFSRYSGLVYSHLRSSTPLAPASR